MENSKPSGIKKAVFIFFTLVIALGILELTLRACGYVYLHVPHPLHAFHGKPGDRTILCLGDSYTQGIGAPYGSSYPEQLAQLLNTNRDTNVRCNVYKEFHINSSTILKYLIKDIERYNPDVVIVMTGCNDRWSLENCNVSLLNNGGFLTQLNIRMSCSNIYKLMRISLINLCSLFNKPATVLNQQNAGLNEEVIFSVKNPLAKEHFDAGNKYYEQGTYDAAFTEFNLAEQLEEDNPWIHFRLAYIYMHALNDFESGKKEALRALTYGKSSIVGLVFIICDVKNPSNHNTNYVAPESIISEMREVIESKFKGKERTDALQYLKIVSSFYEGNADLERVIGYNVDEIVKILAQRNISVILMQYPQNMPWNRRIISLKAHSLGVTLIDNYTAFEDMLNGNTNLRREDLFVKDGHCNAAGYGIVAENVYKTLIQSNILHNAVHK